MRRGANRSSAFTRRLPAAAVALGCSAPQRVAAAARAAAPRQLRRATAPRPARRTRQQDARRGRHGDIDKIGIALIDWETIAQFIDFNHGDEVKVDTALIDAINNAGGIGGRKLDVVFDKYRADRIGRPRPRSANEVHRGRQVFAVLGNIEDRACGAAVRGETHHKILIGHDLTSVEILGADRTA